MPRDTSVGLSSSGIPGVNASLAETEAKVDSGVNSSNTSDLNASPKAPIAIQDDPMIELFQLPNYTK